MILSVLSIGMLAEAQNKPNVTGTWKMNAEKTKFERSGPKDITIKFDLKGSSLNEIFTITDDRERTLNFTYDLDGKESQQQLEDRPIMASAKWEGDSLVIEFKSDEGFNLLRKITVSADGKTITMAVKITNPNGSSNDTVVLEKR